MPSSIIFIPCTTMNIPSSITVLSHVTSGFINPNSPTMTASMPVAVVVLIAIVIFVGYIFKDALVEAVNSVFDQLTEFIG